VLIKFTATGKIELGARKEELELVVLHWVDHLKMSAKKRLFYLISLTKLIGTKSYLYFYLTTHSILLKVFSTFSASPK
jgi:hypothetical protein